VSAQPFTAEFAEGLAGPEWLRARRAARAALAAGVEMPTVGAEEWRYSRIGDFPAADFTTVATGAPAAGALPAPVAAVLAGLGDHCGHIVTVDGVVAAHMGCADAAAAGVTFAPAADGELLAIVMAEAHDAFAAWNDALTVAPIVLDVPAGVELTAPFVVVHHLGTDGAASFPRLVVRAGANSSFSVVEVHVSDDVRALSAPVTELAVGPAARVRHTVVQDLGPRVWQVGSMLADVGQEATWSSAVAALGGEYARMRVDCRLVGRGSTGNVASAYLGSRSQMIDLRTYQEHLGADTTSDLYFKGAVGERSHSVYTGLIRIRPGARGANAVQANRVIKLSDDAWAESVPNLEIENNDVRCAHASTVGPVDPDQRFYLESRGVPPKAADRLIVGGFFDDALDHFPVPEAVTLVRDRLDAVLDREVAPLGSAR